MIQSLEAYVAAALYPSRQALLGETPCFALGDGSVRFLDAPPVQAHDGAILCASLHPSGDGVVTGGDDGRVVWSRPSGPIVLADAKGKWINALDASAQSGLIAFASGRTATVMDASDPRVTRSFAHERTVAGLSFDPKGRRLAAASYGGVWLWYAKVAEQKPQVLRWAGPHLGAAFSPDGRFLFSAMQENALHGWRLSDGADMRMGGYPSKPKSLAFMAKGALMATSGAAGVVWPLAGPGGPQGQGAVEIGAEDGALVTTVAAHLAGYRLCAGLDDGRVWTADLQGRGVRLLAAETGPPVTALAVSPDGQEAAWGREDGTAGRAALGD
jgi:WD40 repeat protein